MNGWSLGRGRRKNSQAEKRNGQGQTGVHGLHASPPHATFKMVDDFRPKRVGTVIRAEPRGLWMERKPTREFRTRILGAGIEKSGTPKRAAQIRNKLGAS